MKKSALVVIDMQEFFFVENSDVDQHALARRCSEIIDLGKQGEMPVIQVATLYGENRVDWPEAFKGDGQSWCSHLVKGSELSHMVSDLVVKPDDHFVEKKRFSAFYNTNLDDILRSLGCPHIFVIGYSADVCLRFTSVDAYNRGYGVTLIYEGIESFRESKDDSVTYLEWLIGAKCISIKTFRDIVTGTSPVASLDV